MKIYFSSDEHLDPADKNGVVVNHNGNLVSSRLLDKINILKAIVQRAISDKCDAFISLGDLFNNLNPPEWLRELYVTEILLPLVEANIRIFLVAGNHGNEKTAIAMKSLNGFNKQFTFVHQPTVIEEGNGSDKIVAFPYFPLNEKHKLQYWLAKYKDCVIFTHLQVSGASLPGEYILLDGFPMEIFNDTKLVISGHIHKQQGIGKVFYIGSIARNNWGEAEYRTWYGVYDTSISPSLQPKPTLDRRFLNLNINYDDKIKPENITNSDFYQKEFVEVAKGAIIRLNVRGERHKLETFPLQEVYKKLAMWGAHNVLYNRIIEKEITVIETSNNSKSWQEIVREKANDDQEKINLAYELLEG
jgi:DNA repair exonuclease SbcCD nuclease subunit